MGKVTVDGPMSNFITDGIKNEVEVCAAIDYAAMGGDEVIVNVYTKDYSLESIEVIKRYAKKRNIDVYFRKDDVETSVNLL